MTAITDPLDDDNRPDAWEPWQFTRFDAPPSSPSASPTSSAVSPAAKNPAGARARDAASATAAELERLRQDARKNGHAEGYAAGLVEGKKQAHTEAQRLAALAGQLEAALEEFDQRMSREVLALSLAVARQIVRQHIEVRPESLLATLRELLAQLHHPQVLISVHPEDAALLRGYLDAQPGHEEHRLHEDPRLQRGGCVIEAGGGQIDASIDTRWKRVVESLGGTVSWLGEEAPPAGSARSDDGGDGGGSGD